MTTPRDPEAPATEAGRALVEHHAMIRLGNYMLVIPQDIARVLVPEIEAAARAEGRREAVREIRRRAYIVEQSITEGDLTARYIEADDLAAILDSAAREPAMDPRYGPDGYPLPGTTESERVALYEEMVAGGMSSDEARGTAWPEQRDGVAHHGRSSDPEPAPDAATIHREFESLADSFDVMAGQTGQRAWADAATAMRDKWRSLWAVPALQATEPFGTADRDD